MFMHEKRGCVYGFLPGGGKKKLTKQDNYFLPFFFYQRGLDGMLSVTKASLYHHWLKDLRVLSW